MAAWVGKEKGNPDEDFEAEDLGCEQARGERCEDAGKDGYCSEEETYGGDVSPEELRRREPFGDPVEQTGHGDDMAYAEGDDTETVEAGDEELAAREGRVWGGE